MSEFYISAFRGSLKAQGKKSATINSYASDLKDFLLYLESKKYPLEQVDPLLISHYFNDMAAERRTAKPNSVRRKIIAFRQFFRSLQEPQALRGGLDQLPIPRRFEIRPCVLSPTDIQSLFGGIKNASQLKNSRDKAIIALLCFDGLKVGELCELSWEDFYPSPKSSTLLIRGDRQRSIKLDNTTAELMHAYAAHFAEQIACTSGDSKVFVAFQGAKAKRLLPHISRHGLKFLLYQIAEAHGVKGVNSENLRHYAITHLHRLGKSRDEIMRHLGLRRLGNVGKIIKEL